LVKEGAVVGEHHDPAVARVGDEDFPIPIHRHANGIEQLAVSGAFASKRAQQAPVGAEHHHAIGPGIRRRLGDKDVPVRVQGNPGRAKRGNRIVAEGAEERAVIGEYLNTAVALIGDEDGPLTVHRHA
jgi:hypothetical protein